MGFTTVSILLKRATRFFFILKKSYIIFVGANIITKLYQPYELFLFLYTFFLAFTAHKLLFLWAYLKKSSSIRHSHHFYFQYLSIICYMPTTLITCIPKFPMIHTFSTYAHQANKMISHQTLNQQKCRMFQNIRHNYHFYCFPVLPNPPLVTPSRYSTSSNTILG